MRTHVICLSSQKPLFWLLCSLVGIVCVFSEAEARFISRFSLSAGEEYNDNIFFSEKKEHDFVTSIIPTVSLAYQSSSQTAPAFAVNLCPVAEIYARHSELNTFGKDLGFNTNYAYRYSPRLTVSLRDRLQRRGEGRASFSSFGTGSGCEGSFGGFGGSGFSSNISSLGSSGGGAFGQSFGGSGRFDEFGSSSENDLLSRGERLENDFEARSSFLYSPTVTFDGGYRWRYIAFLDEGGREIEHSLEVGGVYSRWQEHNLRARYRIGLIKSRDGKNDIIHDVDVGDDFFSSRQIRLTPTLTVFASTGIALSTGDDGFRINNRLNLTAVKVWRTAALAAGVRREFTGSGGVAGPSFTTSFFGTFTIPLTRRLAAIAGTDFSLFDTDEVDFKTFQALAGLQYWLASWLSMNVAYAYRWLDPEGNATSIGFLRQSRTDSNSVFVFLSAYFDIWPNIGLGRGMTSLQPFPSATRGGASPRPARSITNP